MWLHGKNWAFASEQRQSHDFNFIFPKCISHCFFYISHWNMFLCNHATETSNLNFGRQHTPTKWSYPASWKPRTVVLFYSILRKQIRNAHALAKFIFRLTLCSRDEYESPPGLSLARWRSGQFRWGLGRRSGMVGILGPPNPYPTRSRNLRAGSGFDHDYSTSGDQRGYCPSIWNRVPI